MAKIIINDTEYEVQDGTRIFDICEEAGILTSCHNGVCGVCQIKVLEGAENLNELSQEEQDLLMDSHNRLGCQCVINKGTVKVTYS